MILFVDPSKDETQVALLDRQGKFIDEIIFDGKGMQTELLLKKVDLILTRQNIKKTDLFGIIAVSGPGSYTGLRVTLSALNAMAYALDMPIIGVEAENWKDELNSAISKLSRGKYTCPVMPKYKYPAKITIKTRT